MAMLRLFFGTSEHRLFGPNETGPARMMESGSSMSRRGSRHLCKTRNGMVNEEMTRQGRVELRRTACQWQRRGLKMVYCKYLRHLGRGVSRAA